MLFKFYSERICFFSVVEQSLQRTGWTCLISLQVRGDKREKAGRDIFLYNKRITLLFAFILTLSSCFNKIYNIKVESTLLETSTSTLPPTSRINLQLLRD